MTRRGDPSSLCSSDPVKLRYTRHQVPRGTRADGEAHDRLVLAKNVSMLRATYQIRLLTFRAVEERRKLVIMVPERCVVHPTLRQLVDELPKTIRIEKRK